jgi:hypothetical protein
MRRLSPFSDKICWVFKKSSDASRFLSNLIFDFVYIDGLHDYSSVLQDCYNWYPLVKKGGILGGHDFIGAHKDLKRAVKVFCKDWGLKLVVQPPDWWAVK